MKKALGKSVFIFLTAMIICFSCAVSDSAVLPALTVSAASKVTVKKVTGVKATPTSDTVKLTWKKTTKATGYRVYSYNSKTKKSTKIADVKNNKYTVKNLKSNKTYYYKVKAYRKVKGKKYLGKVSSAVKVKTKKAAAVKPQKVSGLKITNGGASNQLKLTWKAQNGVKGYQVYRSESGVSGTYTKVKTVKNGATSYTDKGLDSSKTYYYAVRAYNTQNGKNTFGSYAKAYASTKLTSDFIVDKFNDTVRFCLEWCTANGGNLDYDDFILIDYFQYYRIDNTSVKTKADVKKLFREHFTESVSNKLVDMLYYEINGKLYMFVGEISDGPYTSLSETSARIISQTDKKCTAEITEVWRMVGNEYDPMPRDMTFELVYEKGKWVFSENDYWTTIRGSWYASDTII